MNEVTGVKDLLAAFGLDAAIFEAAGRTITGRVHAQAGKDRRIRGEEPFLSRSRFALVIRIRRGESAFGLGARIKSFELRVRKALDLRFAFRP